MPLRATVRGITYHRQASNEGDDPRPTADDAKTEIENGNARRRRRRHLSRPLELRGIDMRLRRLHYRLLYRRLHVGRHQLILNLRLRQADGVNRWPRPETRHAHLLHGEPASL